MSDQQDKEPLERCAIALERLADLLEHMMIGGAPQDDAGAPDMIEIPDSWERITSFSTPAGIERFMRPDGEIEEIEAARIFNNFR